MILSNANKCRASVIKPLSSLKSRTDYATPAHDSINTDFACGDTCTFAHDIESPRATCSRYMVCNNL